jgi:outer membrane protein assembly factor BamB
LSPRRALPILIVAAAVLAGAVLVPSPGARAGGGTPAPEPAEPASEERTGPWVEEAEPELKAKLAEAERAAGEDRWSDAALVWQDVLDTAPPRLVNIRPDLPNTFADVREVVRLRLLSLPPEGLAAYRRTSDPAAESLLREAVRHQDRAKLEEVVRRFAATTHGPRAVLLLADLALRRGDLEEAIARLERLASRIDGEASPGVDRAGVLVRRAFCRARQGDSRALARLRDEAAALEGAEVVLAGVRRPLAEAVEAIARGRPDRRVPTSWSLPGGDATRSRRALGPARKLVLAGFLPDPEHEETGDPDDRPERDPRSDRFAVVSGNRVFVKSSQRILRLELESGKALDPIPDLDKLGGEKRFDRLEDLRSHVATLWRNWLVAPHESSWTGRETSLLLGLDAERDGLQVWVRGGGREPDDGWTEEPGAPRNPWDEAFYADLAFAGSPAVWAERVFVSAAVFDRKVGAHLLCVDPSRRGRTVWRRQLGYGTALGAAATASPVDLATPGSPAIADGVVYVSTNLGAVAAVDALTGDILWLHRYRRSGSPRIRGGLAAARRRWRTDFPVVADGAVFVTPSDCDRLLVYSPARRPRDGAGPPERPHPPPLPGRGDRVRGPRGRGGRRPAADRPRPAAGRGRPVEARKAWPGGPTDEREDVWVGDPPEDRVTGRGFLTESHLVVPTAKGIYAFALRGDGQARALVRDEDLDLPDREDRRPWHVFGNLTPAGTRIVSVTPDGVFVFRPAGADGSGPPDLRR